MKRLLSIFAALSISVSASAGGGGMGGFAGATEPTQILNNIELVSQVTESMTQTATQINQLTQLQQMLRTLPQEALADLGIPSDEIGQLRGAWSTVGQAIATGNALRNDLGRFRGMIDSTQRMANLSNQDVLGYMQSQVQRFVATGQGLDAERGVERQVMNSISRNYDRYTSLMQKIPQTAGITDSLQLLNGSMGGVLGSIDNLGMVMSSMQRMALDEAAYKADVRAQQAASALNTRDTIQKNLDDSQQPIIRGQPWRVPGVR